MSFHVSSLHYIRWQHIIKSHSFYWTVTVALMHARVFRMNSGLFYEIEKFRLKSFVFCNIWTLDGQGMPSIVFLVLRFVVVNLVLSLCLSVSLSQGTSLLQLMKRLTPRNDFLLLLRCLQPAKWRSFFSLYQWCWLQACPREPWHAILDFLFILRKTLQRKSRP